MICRSRKEREVIFCIVFFCRSGIFLRFAFYSIVQCIEYILRIYILLHIKNITSRTLLFVLNNCGNFIAILNFFAQTNDDLQNHLSSPVEIINIIGYDISQADLINKVKEAKLFSVLGDEVESQEVALDLQKFATNFQSLIDVSS